MTQAPATTTQDCYTCQGKGTIDERLGGYSFSNPTARCPDCNGKGQVSISPTPKLRRGFALLPPGQRAALASLGGRTAHQAGHANTFTPAQAREAAAKSVEVRSAKRSARVQAMSRPSSVPATSQQPTFQPKDLT